MEDLKINIKAAVDSGELDKFGSKLKEIKKEGGSTKEAFGELGKTLGVAFSVEKVVEFAKESIEAFSKAEAQANKLAFAVTKINGEGQGALQGLIDQSEKLGGGLFTPEQIQNSQTMLAQLGLTTEQIKKATPAIIDLAAATGDDLSAATDRFIAGANGQGKALKDVGIAIKDTGHITKNFANVMEGLTKFTGAESDALETTAGKTKKLENAWEEIKVMFGKFLTNEGNDLLDFFSSFSEGMDAVANKRALGIIADQYKEFAGKVVEEAEKSEVARTQEVEKSTKRILVLNASLLENEKKVITTKTLQERKFIQEKLKAETALNSELRKLGEEKDQLTQKGIDAEAAATKKKEEAEKKAAEKSEAEKQKDIDENIKRLEDLRKEHLAILEEMAKDDEDARAKKEKADEEANDAEVASIEANLKSRRELIEYNNKDTYEGQLENLKIEMDAEIAAVGDNEAAKSLIRAQYRDKEKDLDKQANEEKLKGAQELTGALSSLEDVVFSIKDSNLKKGSAAEVAAAKRDFKIKKALSITSAVISGIQGVVNALSAQSVVPEPFGTVLKAATAVAVGVAAAANVAKIASTQFNESATSGGGGGTTGGVGAAGRTSTFTPQSLQQIGGSGMSGFNNPLTPKGGGKPSTTPQKIYVTATDITSSQNKNAVLQRRASFNK